MISHSGIDKRNSFDSNGIFDHNCQGLFKVMIWLLNNVANMFPINHGIHHAYTQLPLEVINRDYQLINSHILASYPNVRYNTVHFLFTCLFFPLPFLFSLFCFLFSLLLSFFRSWHTKYRRVY